MTNTIILYKNSKILPWKNFVIDDLALYLNTLTKLSFTCQFVKHSLNLTYKLNLDQAYLDMQTLYDYDYLLAIDNSSISPYGKSVYYYITDKKWVSSNCIELTLKMDVINTFNGNYTLSAKTTIIRQHKNRWHSGTSPEVKYPLIDLYTEGIQTTLFKKEEHILYELGDEDLIQGSFYLIYRNRNLASESDPNPPVDVLLCGDSPINVNISALGGYSGTLSWKNLDSRATYGSDLVIYKNDSPANTNTTVSFEVWTNKATHYTEKFEFTNGNNAFFLSSKQVAVGILTNAGFIPSKTITYKWFANKEFNDFQFTNLKCARQVISSASFTDLTPTYIGNAHAVSMISNYLGSNGTIMPISEIDRTDPKLVKIIKLPYRPVAFSTDAQGEMIALPDGWIFEDNLDFPNMLRYTGSTTTAIVNNMFLTTEEDDTYVSPFEIAGNQTIDMTKRIARNINYETKLLHSDYFIQKFVYDSFSFNYALEYLDTTDLTGQSLYINFDVSLTMSSKFMFDQTAYKSFLEIDIQDYSGIVYVARNNEVPIFNSEYINYIKAGYNYDIKTRNRQLNTSLVSGILQLGGAVVSAIAGGPIGVAGAVGLGISAVSTFIKTATSTAQADQNISQKLKQAEQQAVSVNGADDVDLMTEYTYDNKAKIVVYEISERMKKCMFDLFHYFGYVANYQGIPNTTSRKCFNFIQADIVFATIPNFTKEIGDEIIAKYKEGITFIHHYSLYDGNNAVSGWDLDQQYENWEVNTSN